MSRLAILFLLSASLAASIPILSHASSMERAVAEIDDLAAQLDDDQISEEKELAFTKNTNLMDKTLKAGESLDFLCEGVSTPPSNVYWTLNDRIVQGTRRRNIVEKMKNVGHKVIGKSNTASRFSLPCVDQKDAGVLKCIVDNGHSRIEKAVRITVEGASKCGKKVAGPPFITMWSDFRLEDEGNSVVLFCRTPRARTSTIEWTNVDGQPLNDVEGFQVLSNGDLLIETLSDKMGDGFTCTVSNAFGSASETTYLYTTVPSSDDSPRDMEESE